MEEALSETHTRTDWAPVLIAIAVTGILAGLIGGILSSRHVSRITKERSASFQKRQDSGTSIFTDLIKETEETTE